MSNLTSFPDQVHGAFQPTERGVVGLVDELLAVCRDQAVLLDWSADHCRVRPLGAGLHEVTAVPLRGSVFRAILARVAALCNESKPNSVSPYGGQGELTVSADPAVVLRVAFSNTPSEQRLELTPGRSQPATAEARVQRAPSSASVPEGS